MCGLMKLCFGKLKVGVVGLVENMVMETSG